MNRTILRVLNTSFISLIPKQENAQTPDRYKHIALRNVVYKIISKVVANKFKPLLPSLISGEQSGYVEGRQILDNIIQAHEVTHSLTSTRRAGMILQLDIAKAYDKVNWTYIWKVLQEFAFDHNWMAKAGGSAFSVSLHTHDGSSCPVYKECRVMGKIQGLPLKENGQALTHQKFVDDTMLQRIPIVKEARAYKQILNEYAMASGILVLKKAVLQSIPIFMLSALPAPKGVLQQFRNIQRDFLWGREEARKKWALVSWEKICKAKNHRGLGIDDQEILSNVLGAKL
eukprot:PITA_34049